MMTALQQNLFTFAAAKLAPWGGLLRRLPFPFSLPLTRALPTAPPRAVASKHANVKPASCVRPTAPPAHVGRFEPARHAIKSTAPRQTRANLRVVRIVETDQAWASSGRIVMCGRMADVCAELDRMVEREAAQLARA